MVPTPMQVQDNLRVALQVAADEAAKGEHDDPIPAPVEVAQLVEEAMFGFYGAYLTPVPRMLMTVEWTALGLSATAISSPSTLCSRTKPATEHYMVELVSTEACPAARYLAFNTLHTNSSRVLQAR